MARAPPPPPLHRLPALLAALCLAVAVCFSGVVENAAAATLAADRTGRKMVGVHELRMGDFSIKVTNWGATLMSVILPDSKGSKLTLLFHASYYSFSATEENPASFLQCSRGQLFLFFFSHRRELGRRCARLRHRR